MALDTDSLTLGEIAYIEKLGGYSLASLSDDAAPKGNMLAALTVVVARRNGQPAFKWNDALALTVEAAYEIIGIEIAEDEDEPIDDEPEIEAPAPKARRSTKTSPASNTP